MADRAPCLEAVASVSVQSRPIVVRQRVIVNTIVQTDSSAGRNCRTASRGTSGLRLRLRIGTLVVRDNPLKPLLTTANHFSAWMIYVRAYYWTDTQPCKPRPLRLYYRLQERQIKSSA
jgi:hypothetical protein